MLAQIVRGGLPEETHVTDERYLVMATALGGSDPACVFLVIEVFVDAGVHIGLPLGMAQESAIQTMLGSTRTVERAGEHPADLRNTATSPGGSLLNSPSVGEREIPFYPS